MSNLRLPYFKLSPEAYSELGKVKFILDQSSLGKKLIELVYLRISQINGCAFCLEMHAKALREDGETDNRLDSLAGWRVSSLFSEQERAALNWAESLTFIEKTGAPDNDYESLNIYFNEVEISDLTFAIALMNAFNRLAIGMRQ